MGFFTRKYVGLEIGTGFLKTAELTLRGSRVEVTRAGVRAIPAEAYNGYMINNPLVMAEAIQDLWQDSGIKATQVTVAIGGPQVLFRILTMPKMPPGELRAALRWELESYFPLPAEEAVFDYATLRTVAGMEGEQDEILVVAVPRRIVESYLETLDLAGVEARALEPEPLALLRALDPGEHGVRLVLAVGSKYTSIILAAGRNLLFTRIVPWGTSTLEQAQTLPVTTVPLPAGREFLRECRRSLKYYQARALGEVMSPQEIVVYGEVGEENDYLLEILGAEFGLPVRMATLLEEGLTWGVDIPVPKRALYAVSIGLALREVKIGGKD